MYFNFSFNLQIDGKENPGVIWFGLVSTKIKMYLQSGIIITLSVSCLKLLISIEIN